MSYSAYVICRCWQDGKTDPPPHGDYIRFDDEGLYLDVPLGKTKDEQDCYIQMYLELESWKETACPHKDMYFAYEYLSNISGMGNFRCLLRTLGLNNRFITLKEYLPACNSGILPANAAKDALEEIEIIENCFQVIQKTSLEEVAKGHVIYRIYGDDSTAFYFNRRGSIQYCLDKEGFFVLENKKHIIFRSKHFIQEPQPDDVVKLTDLPSGRSIETQGGIATHPNPLSQNEFVITCKTVPISEEYSYMTVPLRKLLTASLGTGNPIHWT